jgi:hypothetical protein
MDNTTIAVVVVVVLIVILLFSGSGASILSPASGGLQAARAQALRNSGVYYQGQNTGPHHMGQASFRSAAALKRSKAKKDKKGKVLTGHTASLHKSKLNSAATKSVQVF